MSASVQLKMAEFSAIARTTTYLCRTVTDFAQVKTDMSCAKQASHVKRSFIKLSIPFGMSRVVDKLILLCTVGHATNSAVNVVLVEKYQQCFENFSCTHLL